MFNRVNLNGGWDFIVDLDPKYHRENFYADPSWDRRNWRKVSVPGVWNKYAPELDIYEGVCWFSRKFEIEDLPASSISRLRFGGVNSICDVFLNGKQVGKHVGGYTEFCLDVSKFIKTGENLLAVKVDNRATSSEFPHVQGYFNYGGIHRDVSLEIAADGCFENYFISAEHNGSLTVKGQVVGLGPRERFSVRVRGGNMDKTTSVAGDGTFSLKYTFDNIKPWSPESPNLYPITIDLLMGEKCLDARREQIGFRTIEVADRRILLNNKPLFMTGICYVYDSPEFGLVLDPKQYKVDLDLIQEMGCNTIRSHFPFTKEFYTECDKRGVMIWVEPPIYCIHPGNDEAGTIFSDPEIQQDAVGMAREMVVHARNHPSVVIYGIGNECNLENSEAEGFFRAVANQVNKLDATRPLSYACLYGNIGPIGDIVDIIGINQYWGWYDRLNVDGTPIGTPYGPADLKKFIALMEKLNADFEHPVLLTEFGVDSVPGLRSVAQELWSEDYHAYLLKETIEIAGRYEDVCGTFPFCFLDYRDPSKYVGSHWDGMNLKGVVSYERRKKQPFEILKSLYTKQVRNADISEPPLVRPKS